MGFFSWNTQDTDRSIANAWSGRETFKVIMTDDKGNQFVEENYDGYGRFGGKDYYELVDEMNGGDGDRGKGINLFFAPAPDSIFPSLSESGKYFDGKRPNDCEFQGYFYDDVMDEIFGGDDDEQLWD